MHYPLKSDNRTAPLTMFNLHPVSSITKGRVKREKNYNQSIKVIVTCINI